MSEVLECWLHGTHVGRFERQTGRAARLVYDADATRAVSLSLPVDAPAPDGAAEHYLRGLLPEDPVALRDMMRASGATSTDTFELLRQVGGDVAGAVQLTAPGSEPGRDPDHEPLIASTADIGARIAGIKARPTASAFAGDWPLRFSLAGAQAKFALARIGGSWYRPDAQTPSTHIVKPGAARNKHIEAFEARAMELVRRAGFAVPRARVAHFDDQSAYVVERFDRELMPSGFSRRLHVEDLQQALGHDPEGKYLTSLAEAIALLRRHDSELAYCFVEQLAINTAIGNADAHAKNYSIMLENEPRLSPLYDLVPLGAYPQYSQRLTMPIGSRRHTGNITLKDWTALAVDCDLEPDHVVSIVSDVNQRLSSQLEPTFGEFAARYSNLGKAVRQMQHYMTRNTDQACLDTVRPETPLTGCHDHQFEDGSDADPEMEK